MKRAQGTKQQNKKIKMNKEYNNYNYYIDVEIGRK